MLLLESCLLLTGIVGFVLSTPIAQNEAPTPQSGQSIGDYFAALSGADPVEELADSNTETNIVVEDSFAASHVLSNYSILSSSSNTTAAVSRRLVYHDDQAEIERRQISSGLVSRSEGTAYEIYTSFKNTTTGGGYNISLPAGTCSTTVIPSFKDPNTNRSFDNVALGAMLGAYQMAITNNIMDDQQWKAYTRQNLEYAQSILFNHLSNDCGATHGGADGGLKVKSKRDFDRVHPRVVNDFMLQKRDGVENSYALGTGWWTAAFLATVPGFFVTLGTVDWAITSNGNHNISHFPEAVAIVSVGWLSAMVNQAVWRMDFQRRLGGFEIILLNLMASVVTSMGFNVPGCFATGSVIAAVDAYAARIYENPTSGMLLNYMSQAGALHDIAPDCPV